MKIYKNCQSCGMPLKKDPEGGGTNLDGSHNLMYCSYCYEKGEFTQNFNVDEMRNFVIARLIDMKFPNFLARFLTKNIYRLERWI